MKKRKICAFLLQLVIIATCVFCVSADNTVFAEEATDLQISVDKTNCIVTVTNTKNGSVWTTNPLNPQEDQYTTPATINDIRSQLVVTYYDKENKKAVIGSYISSIRRGSFKITEQKNKIRID